MIDEEPAALERSAGTAPPSRCQGRGRRSSSGASGLAAGILADVSLPCPTRPDRLPGTWPITRPSYKPRAEPCARPAAFPPFLPWKTVAHRRLTGTYVAVSIADMQYLDRTLAGIEANLALDEALLVEADEGRGGSVLRLWELDKLAVVLGSTCRIGDDVHVERCRTDGIPIARRSSGGGTVLVGPGALNVTVVLPNDAAPGLSAVDLAQQFVLERIAASIRARGPAVEVRGLGDLTVGLRKFAGSAQRRLKRWFLVHASILYRFPLDRIARYTTLPGRQPAYRAERSHEDFLTNLDLPRAALVEAIRAAWDAPSLPGRVPEDRVRQLVATRYADPAWNERL